MSSQQADTQAPFEQTDQTLIEEDIHSFLARHQRKELLRFVAVGSVDDGKSTLIGRLLHDADQVYEDQLADARSGDGNEEIDFALLTDGLRAEREQGITIDVAYRYFHTERRKFIIADTPGHVQYTRNMATGASTADLAVILIDARLGVLQQSKRHAYIASLLGIPHLTVCVNKMDLKDYSQEVFESIRSDFLTFTDKLGFADVCFLPISAKFGVNVVHRGKETPWYKGPTLLEHLETVSIDHDRNMTDFRLPIQYVLRPHQDYRGFSGQIASGVLKQGDPILALPSGKTSKVKLIDSYNGPLEEAFAPMSVTVCLEDEIDISRGDMLVHPDRQPQVSRTVEATLVWMNETPLDLRQPYLIKHTTQTVRVQFDAVLWKSDPNTLEPLPADQLELNEIGRVRMTCHRPLYFDAYQDNRATGAFILIDTLTNETLAAGMLERPSDAEGPAKQRDSWKALQDRMWVGPREDLRLDLSQMDLTDAYIKQLESSMNQAFQELQELEAGAIANPDEGRMVGHYWLRAPALAPTQTLRDEIERVAAQIQSFAQDIHAGTLQPEVGARFTELLLIGIGGSALGPQFLEHALARANAPMRAHYIDNTDPDGIDKTLATLGDKLDQTLVLVISKSGGTKETRNGMLEVQAAFQARGRDFGKHAAAVTGRGSALETLAHELGMLAIFPMWDWVGGRTSMFSAVGLLPAALLGIDTEALKEGAAFMDRLTRIPDLHQNPAAQLALAWHRATEGKARRAMVMLPYKDRLALFGRYTQQLIMESLGKQFDRDGATVHQGLTVYGNKGSTDQHAFVQQLREGPDDFFAQFIEVAQDREGPSIEVEPNVTSGDYLLGFLLGTREAFRQQGRLTATLTLPDTSAFSIGMLVALFERTVTIYASLININAYHQPGVEAGKRAAATFLELQAQAIAYLKAHPTETFDVETLARTLDAEAHKDSLLYLLEHLAANGRILRHGEALLTRSYQARS